MEDRRIEMLVAAKKAAMSGRASCFGSARHFPRCCFGAIRRVRLALGRKCREISLSQVGK